MLLASNVKKEYLASGLRLSAQLIETLRADLENNQIIEGDLLYTNNEFKRLEAIIRRLRKTAVNY